MAVYPDTLNPEQLTDRMATELWRRAVQVGEGKVVLLGACRRVDDPEQGQVMEASVTVTSYCCPRCLPVSSVVLFNGLGDQAVEQVKDMAPATTWQA